MKKTKAAFFWSGGKDSAYALYQCLQNPHLEIVVLVCTLSEKYKRISMHGIREELLDIQASSIGIPLMKMWMPDESTNLAYEKVLSSVYQTLRKEGIEQVVFGDIFLEDLRDYRDGFLQQHELKGHYPIWGRDSRELAQDFVELGFQTCICCVNDAYLDDSYLGRSFDSEFLHSLPASVDPCGENGEFHSFCFNGPIFGHPVEFQLGEKVYKPINLQKADCDKVGETLGFWYQEMGIRG